MKIIHITFLLSLIFYCFEPENVVLGKRIFIGDFFFLTSILLFLAWVVISKKNISIYKYEVFLLVFLGLQSAIQLFAQGASYINFLDLFKVIKWVFPFLLLRQVTSRNLVLKIEKLIKWYLLLSVLACFAQLVIPDFQLFKLWGSEHHFRQLHSRPYGFLGSPSVAGPLALFILSYFLIKKETTFIFLALLLVFLHTNKASILIALMLLVIFLSASYNKKTESPVFGTIALFVFVCLISGGYLGIWTYLLGFIENLENHHTFAYRVTIYQLAFDLFLERPIEFFSIGFSNKVLWKTFDSQYILLLFRYGVIGFFLLYQTCVLYFDKTLMKVYFFPVIFIGSLTFYPFYQSRSSLLIASIVMLSKIFISDNQNKLRI